MNCILKIIQLDDILLAGQEHFLKIRRKQEVDEKMKSKFTKLLATALVLCLVLALLPAAAFAASQYTFTFNNDSGSSFSDGKYTFGQITVNGDTYDASKYNDGDRITLKAEPKPNCALAVFEVTVGGVAQTITDDDTCTFDLTGNVVVKAAFRQLVEVGVAIPDEGIADIGVLPAYVIKGDTVTVTVTPKAGYKVTEIFYTTTGNERETIAENSNTGSFIMPAGEVTVSAVATAIPTHKVTVTQNMNGYVSTSPSGEVAEGTPVTVTARPVSGYEVEKIVYFKTGSGSIAPFDITDNPQFNMPAHDVTVEATFKEIEAPTTDHSIVLADNITGGEILSSAYSAEAGETVYIYVYPERGWTTKDVYYKTTADSGIVPTWQYLTHEYWKDTQSYEVWSFVMPDHGVYVYADFTYYDNYGTYYIDTSYDSTLGGVEVWVNNNYVNNWHQGSWADYNDTVSFKVKPYYSDDVVSVSVVGKRTGWTYSYDYNSYSGWYTFTMPNEDVTINVDFRSGVHKVYVDKVTDGKLTVSDDWAKYGQIVYITAVPDYGCTLSSLSVRTATGDSVHVYNAQKADTYYFYMPDQYVSVSAVFTGKYTSLPFNDVSYGDWYYDAVQFVYSKGIMDGVDYYKFAPNGTITRGMIVTMLWRMAGEPFEMPVTSFTDVEIGRYYTTAVAWACRNGIADGMGESTFGPNDAITREELVTLLYRYAQYFGHSCIGTSIEGFADAGSVSSYAYNAMCWAYKAGVVTGTTGSRLNPQGTASRAEAAQMIMSFYSFLNS